MADGPVVFIDSGIGGLPYVSFTRSLAPDLRYVHVADRGNFPYGRKTPEDIILSTVSLAERAIARENPSLIVVACNTMSVVALEALRSRFDIPFVGVVPAIKPAAALSRKKSIGILATPRTVEGDYLARLIGKFANGCRVVGISAQDLVGYVETELFRATAEQRRLRVRTEAERFREQGVDTVVLACTHFLHLEEEFRLELGPGVTIVDSRDGVARQALRLLAGRGRTADALNRRDALYVTGDALIEERYSYFAEKFGMVLEGIL
jgi:glutamate racemase